MTAPHERLRARLGDPALYLDDPADTAPYGRDWIGKYEGAVPLVVRPRSTAEVSAVLAACTELDVPVPAHPAAPHRLAEPLRRNLAFADGRGPTCAHEHL